jgi:hypothetical protein
MLRHTTAALVLASLSVPAQEATPLTLSGERFQIVCHFHDAKVAADAQAVCDATWEVAAKLYDAKAKKPAEPLSLHLYRTPKDYEEAEAKITAGRFKPNLAFAHFETRSAHVAVQPQLTDEFLAQSGLNYQTRRLIAHEAAHLVRFALMPNYRHHPDWFADGIASQVEAEVMQAMEQITSPREDPYFSTCIHRAKLLLTARKLPTPEEFLTGKSGELEPEDRYAARWVFVDFLQQKAHQKKLQKAIADLHKLGDEARDRDKVEKTFERSLKTKSLDKPFEKWVKELDPVWNEVLRSLQTAGDQWTQVAFDDANALCWNNDPAGNKPYTLTGKFTILADKSLQMNVLLGGDGAGFLSVALVADYGITLFEYHGGENSRWETLLFKEVKTIKPGEPVPFEIEWNKNRKRELAITIHGEEVIRHKIIRGMEGNWGIGVQEGGAGLWQDLKLAR